MLLLILLLSNIIKQLIRLKYKHYGTWKYNMLKEERTKRKIMENAMKSILKEIRKQDEAIYFKRPVDTRFYNNYLKIIQKPMDLLTISVNYVLIKNRKK